MSLSVKNLLLIDGIGAFISALCLGFILPVFKAYTGLPNEVLFMLSLPAACFSVYSLLCYLKTDYSNTFWLKLVAFANSSYCMLTLVMVLLHFSVIKPLGLVYFTVETLVIITLVYFELKAVKRENLN